MKLTKNKIPTYPRGFFQFGTAESHRIQNDEINRWIKQCIDKLDDKLGDIKSIASGDTKVEVFRTEEGIEIEVSRGYDCKTIWLGEEDEKAK